MKAILILNEMPSCCGCCDMCYVDKDFKCYRCKAHYDEALGDESVRQSWCPLKPIPNKRNNYVMYENAIFVSAEEQIAYLCGYEDGWNDCINELVGDEE